MKAKALTKSDLVKKINYYEVYQDIANALPVIITEKADQLTNAEVQVIKEFGGNISLMSLAITKSIQSLYKALPEPEDVKQITMTAYSNFLYNIIQGLLLLDHNLLKAPLCRLFGTNIMDGSDINHAHPMLPYLKCCGIEFIEKAQLPFKVHLSRALKESFLSFQPYQK